MDLSKHQIITSLNDSISNIRKFVVKCIIEDMREKQIINFGNVQDMIVKNDAWLMPDSMDLKPVRLSQIDNINLLIQIYTDLCKSEKQGSSRKLYGFETISIN